MFNPGPAAEIHRSFYATMQMYLGFLDLAKGVEGRRLMHLLVCVCVCVCQAGTGVAGYWLGRGSKVSVQAHTVTPEGRTVFVRVCHIIERNTVKAPASYLSL